jgi:hypothetical protein
MDSRVIIVMTKEKLYALSLAAGMLVTAAVPWVAAQTVKRFDVVSIKPDRDSQGLDAGAQPGGRYTARNVPAEFLVTEAFGIKGFQDHRCSEMAEGGTLRHSRESRDRKSAQQRATEAPSSGDVGESLRAEISHGNEGVSRLFACSGKERSEVPGRQQYSGFVFVQSFFK